MADPDAEETRADRRTRYGRVLACVTANVHPDPETRGVPGCPRRQVHLSLDAHGSYDRDRLDSSLQAAVENDDLYRWDDRRGETRYTPVREEPLCALTHHVVAEGHPETDRITADCNRLRQNLSDR